MSRNTARLFRHERRAISAGLKSCSTVASEQIMSRSSARLLPRSDRWMASCVLPARFIVVGLTPSEFLGERQTQLMSANHIPSRQSQKKKVSPHRLIQPYGAFLRAFGFHLSASVR